jgi:hypothetical protein
MRFVSIFQSTKPSSGPPSEAEMAAMGALVEKYMKSGNLVVTEPLAAPEAGARVERSNGKVTVGALPGPAGGYAIMQADTREECIALCKEFLEVAGDGVCEFRQIVDMG